VRFAGTATARLGEKPTNTDREAAALSLASSVRPGKETRCTTPGNGLRYLVHFDDGSSGMRHRDQPARRR
jgi:hypothetical protein